MSFQIYIASTRGMCAGVDRAIDVVNLALDKYGKNKIYVYHEVVHNKHVVQELKDKGATFVESLDEVPEGKILIFSSHGVGQDIVEEAERRGFYIIDATCPLVKRVHRKINQASKEGKETIVIGHHGHQEVKGHIGQYLGDKKFVHVVENEEDVAKLKVNTDKLMFATQTTLSIDETAKTVAALRNKFATIEGPRSDDTCFATQLRQTAIKDLSEHCELILVAGSKNSSNSNRLAEVAKQMGCESYLIDDYTKIDDKWLQGIKTIGISAGASVPEKIVEEIISYLKTKGGNDEVIPVGSVPKEVAFPLPDNI